MASFPFAKLNGIGLELARDDMTLREGDLGWQRRPHGDDTRYVDIAFWVTAGPGHEAALGDPSGNPALVRPIALTGEHPRVSLRFFGATAWPRIGGELAGGGERFHAAHGVTVG